MRITVRHVKQQVSRTCISGGTRTIQTSVLLLFEASDVTKAKEFVASSDLKEKMQAAGVQGPPDIVILSEG